MTEQFRDYLYYAPEFVVYTDNNPLTYVLTSGKLMPQDWVGDLADLNFEIRYRPGKLNADADSLSRLPADFLKPSMPQYLQSKHYQMGTMSGLQP